MKVTPYLNFNGDCEEAFKFYAQCLGGQIAFMQRHSETPMADHVGPEWQDKIIHTQLLIGDNVLMGSDSPPDYYTEPKGLFVSLHPETVEEAERIFNEMAEGGTVTMPLQETFWAARFGMVADRFGTPWMINCDKSE